jgi:hypothetical protein
MIPALDYSEKQRQYFDGARTARLANALLLKRWEHLFHTRIFLRGHLPDREAAGDTQPESPAGEWTPATEMKPLINDQTFVAK